MVKFHITKDKLVKRTELEGFLHLGEYMKDN